MSKKFCSDCSRCKSRKSIVKPEIHYQGKRPDLFILGEAPGANEDITGKPFVGRAGEILRIVLKQVTDEYILDNSARCFSDSKPNPSQLKACRPNWVSIVKRYEPKLIVALGNYAAEAILGKKIKISTYVGQSTSVYIGGKHYLVIFNYHPSHILRSRGEKGGEHERKSKAWLDTWDLTQTILDSGVKDVPETHCLTDLIMIRGFLNVLSKGKSEIAYDYETTSNDGNALRPELCDDFRILSIGVAAKGVAGTSFTFDTKDKYASPDISMLWQSIVSRGNKPNCQPCIAQNVKYEHKCNLKRFGFTAYLSDTMLAMNTIDELAGASLGVIGHYCGISWAGYKLEMTDAQKDPANVPLKRLLRYSALEGRLTYESWRFLIEKIKSMGLQGVLQMQQRIAYHLAHIEMTGMHADPRAVVDVHNKIKAESKLAWQEFRGHTAIRKTERWAINNIKSFKKGSRFNPKSAPQMHHLCLDVLKLKVKPAKYKWKDGKRTEGTVSLDKNVLQKFEHDHPILKNLAKIRSLSAMLSGFLDKYEDYTGPDGCVHTNFTQVVVVTNRLSSTAPNLQNIPLDSLVRRVFNSRFRNGYIVAADYIQLEPVLLAGWSGDKLMCKAINEGKDLHRFVGSKIYRVDYDKVSGKQRWIAKRRNLGSMYGQTIEGLADACNIPYNEAKEIFDIYDKTFIGTTNFRLARGREAVRCGMVKDLFGAIRHLRNAQSTNLIKRERALRQAGNFPIQSTGNRFHLIAMCVLREYLIREQMEAVVIGVEHDKILIDSPGSELRRTIKLTVDAMLIHNHQWYWKDMPVKLRVDVKYGRNLYEMKEFNLAKI